MIIERAATPLKRLAPDHVALKVVDTVTLGRKFHTITFVDGSKMQLGQLPEWCKPGAFVQVELASR